MLLQVLIRIALLAASPRAASAWIVGNTDMRTDDGSIANYMSPVADFVNTASGPFNLTESVEDHRNSLANSVAQFGGTPAPGVSWRDELIPGYNGDPALSVRIYRPWPPRAHNDLPAVVYAHGGAWALSNVSVHNTQVTHLVKACHCVHVSVEYRLAPESKFPGAVRDVYAALVWTYEHASELNVRADAIGVGGDSSGGNLAVAAAIMALRAGAYPPVRFQALIYPAVTFLYDDPAFPSITEFAFLQTYGLDQMLYFRDLYFESPADYGDPLASPYYAEDSVLELLPPGLVVTAEFDTLRDEGTAWAAKMSELGIAMAAWRVMHLIHPFYIMRSIFPLEVSWVDAVYGETVNMLCGTA